MFDPDGSGTTAPIPPRPPMPNPGAHRTTAMPLDSGAHYPFRLLSDERVLATYPITARRRMMGTLVSFLFVTDSRLIYAAESKTWFSTSVELEEHRLDKVEGLETRRRHGLTALGAGIAAAILLNIILFIAFGVFVTSASASFISDPEDANPFLTTLPIGSLFAVLSGASILVGVAVIISLARPTAYLAISGTQKAVPFAESRDWLTLVITVILILVLGPGALLLWFFARALGLFQVSDALLYANPKNIDFIAYDAGAVILDAQTRGTLAGS